MADQTSPAQDPQSLQDIAADVLSREQAAPGSQDPDYVRWAESKLSGGQTAAPTPSLPVAPTQPQPPQPLAAPISEGNETVLQIQQIPGQTIQPTENVIKPNGGQGAPQ